MAGRNLVKRCLVPPHNLLGSLPEDLRTPLLEEYQSIIQSYSENRWLPSELSGGRFCEIVFTIVEGYATSKYAISPEKPQDFVAACRSLEKNTHVPRSFQILIPRLLSALFEVRNNRGVGHVGGDVDPNYTDATFVVTSCSWVMGELIRVFHNVSIEEAQSSVDSLAQRRIPLIWEGHDTRRVLQPNLLIRSQILLLLATSKGSVNTCDLLNWIECKNVRYFKTLLRNMHSQRLVELYDDGKHVEILPPGRKEASEIIRDRTAQLQTA